jgi:riboflavin synthase
VDGTAVVKSIEEKDGSWVFQFEHELDNRLIIHKGSICLNGVSLTVSGCSTNAFTVAIIPYTYEHTNFHLVEVGDHVNVELDVLGKYILGANLHNK